jgi:hypothetical protein
MIHVSDTSHIVFRIILPKTILPSSIYTLKVGDVIRINKLSKLKGEDSFLKFTNHSNILII